MKHCKTKKNVYEIIGMVIILLIVASLSILAVVTENKYENSLEVNEDLRSSINSQKDSYEETISQLESRYNGLYSEYEDVIKKNNKLEKQLKRFVPPEYDYTEEEIYLLAQCVEAEAGEDNEASQKYVAQVILNRVHSDEFPNSVEEVIYQKTGNVPQFSVAYNGMIDREVKSNTLANVYSVIVNGTALPEYVHYFYDISVTGNWVNTLPIYDIVEGTVFAYENGEDY